MRKETLPPLFLLILLFASTLWIGTSMKADVLRWQDQLQQADLLARQERWTDAESTLSDSYRDWSSKQISLHIISRHDAVDDAETMYRRALSFASTQEIHEFRAELADLHTQLHLLAEMEAFKLKNIL